MRCCIILSVFLSLSILSIVAGNARADLLTDDSVAALEASMGGTVASLQTDAKQANEGSTILETGACATAAITPAILPYTPGDANEDGNVDALDLTTVLNNFNKTGMSWTDGDFNYDATINGYDLGTVLANYGSTGGITASTPSRPAPFC